MMRDRVVAGACLAAVVITLVATGLYGIDFGLHWDEWYEVEATREAIEVATMADPPAHDRLQYIYNGVYTWPGKLAVLANVYRLIPEALVEVYRRPQYPYATERYPALVGLRNTALAYTETEQFKIHYRSIFLFMSALFPIFVFLAMLEITPRRYLIAAAAAAFAGLSFEFATHARWPAVDAVMTALVAAAIWLSARALRPRSRLSAALALAGVAVTAGLLLGCKVTGLFAFAPALILPWLCGRTFPRFHERLLLMLGVGLLATGTFVVTDPHLAADPFRVIHTLGETRVGYADDDLPNAVGGPLGHLRVLAGWLGLFAGSPSRAVSLLLAVCAAVGAVKLVRSHPRLVAAWGAWLAGVMFVLMGQPLLLVRNYLPLLALVALAFGMGLFTVFRSLEKQPRLRTALAWATVFVFVFNGASLAHAAWTIRTTDARRILDDTVAYLGEQEHDLLVSPRLHAAIGERLAPTYECAPRRSGDEASLREPRVAMYYNDHNAWRWLTNRIDFCDRTFGPRIVNFHYYATWRGRDEETRTVVMPLAHAEEMRVAMHSFLVCRRR